MSNEAYKRTLSDFHPGQEFEHWPHKTITESDNNQFCMLTMNHHPLHSDVEYAARQQHGKIVVVGTYVLSLAVGMSVPDISGACIANLEFEKITHHHPVFIGDTIRARTRIVEVKLSKTKPDRGVVTVITKAYNQNGDTVLSLRRKILIPKELP
ncbi:MaoC family dehydratase [bacterium]|nr:MaoC family dehydratase [bacterium]MBU1652894.1 MaoC family dehydratase [bacterium]MBU1881011.1 MaoC family dehydratase [bacterium]